MENNISNADKLISGLKGYVERMIHIRSLSSPEIRGIADAEAYSEVLLENFKEIGVLAEQNRDLIAEVINPILESREPLDDEMIKAVGKLNEELLDASSVESIDLPIVSLLTDRLLYDADMKEDIDYSIAILDKVVENCYLLINLTKRVISEKSIEASYREKGLKALERMMVFLDKESFSRLSAESREIIMVNARYGAALYESIKGESDKWSDKELGFLEKALDIAKDPFYRELMPDYDWNYHIFRIYDYLMRLDYSGSDDAAKERAVGYVDKCLEIWNSDPEYYGEFDAFEEIEGRRLYTYYVAGRISYEEFREKLYEIYQRRNMQDYSAVGYDMNVEYPMNYIIYTRDGDMSEKDMRRVDEIYRSALSYIFHMPKLGLLSATLDPYSELLVSFREFPGNIGFEEMGINSFAALHPPTYIHSKMVANITRCLARHLMRLHPEMFESVFACLGIENSEKNRDAVIDYAYHAALCHDFGKLMIIDTIFVYGRKLLDMEFELIKQHPDIGYMLLSSHASTEKYADVARGHHLWYDLSRGYPSAFDAAKCPVKVIIDIVAIADCMDAATDSVGRSYNRGKTFFDYEQEVIKDAGSRYAPWGPELLADEKTRKDLQYLLGEGRMLLYRDTYTLLSSLGTGKEI